MTTETRQLDTTELEERVEMAVLPPGGKLPVGQRMKREPQITRKPTATPR